MSDPTTVRVRIPEGVAIRDPITGRVAATGDVYPRAGFWNRRLAAGEVTELAPDSEEPAAGAAEREH
jgi:hypothetical protein